jgi:hypothetical protein
MRDVLVNDVFVWRVLVELDVGDLERAHGLDGGRQRGVSRVGAPPALKVLPRGSEGPKNLRAVEPLAGAVLAKAHRRVPRTINIFKTQNSQVKTQN